MQQQQQQQKPKRPELLIPIPAGAPIKRCEGKDCGRVFYWALHPKTGRNHPVSIDHPSAVAPTKTTDGVGISHYGVCPNADDFRTPRTAK